MLTHLLFGGRLQMDGEVVAVMPEYLLALIQGAEAHYRNNRYRGEALLEAFRDECLPSLSWSDWNLQDGKAREVKALFSKAVVEAIEADYAGYREADARVVYIEDGTRFTKNTRTRSVEEYDEAAAIVIAQVDSPEAREVAAYMNGLPINSFAKFVKNVPEAQVAAAEWDDTLKQQQEALIRVREFPKPLYRASAQGNSPRLYGDGLGLLTLKKELRTMVMRGAIELDMANFHLAYAAMAWDIPELQAFLETGKSFWVELLEYLELDATAKPVLKEAMYGIMYGMSSPNLSLHLKESFPDRLDVAERFLQQPLVSRLFYERNRKMAEVKQAGGLDVPGVGWVPVVVRTIRGKYRDNVASLLSRQAQTYELKALVPAVRLAAAYPKEVKIVLWQHDGFSLVVMDKRREAMWVERVKGCVNDELKRLGIRSQLMGG